MEQTAATHIPTKRLQQLALLLTFFLALASTAIAGPIPRDSVPDALKSWIPWVLHKHPDATCPYFFNSDEDKTCSWPASLNLVLKQEGGKFSQVWTVYKADWILLPGGRNVWPKNVTINGKAAAITSRDDRPGIAVPAGTYHIDGEFSWRQLPENLQIPPETGIVSLQINDQLIQQASVDESGLLWLQQGPQEQQVAKLDLKVFRRIEDGIPLKITSIVRLTISGKNREILLPQVILPDQEPQSVHSTLPAKLEPDGRLRVQVRPGEWDIEITSRRPRITSTLSLPKSSSVLATEEVWVFDAKPEIRQVNIEGLRSIDPQQTQLPETWKKLPAYHVVPGDAMRLHESRRGESSSPPDALSLTRVIWLDFTGGGYTVRDSITGVLNRSWRLETLPGMTLGRASLQGVDQFITRASSSGMPGVEVRHGNVSLTADSRIDSGSRTLSASGWKTDFQQASAVLQLPPGWKLFGVSGVDKASGSWLGRWNLLDFFVVLIASAACAKLWSKGWAALCLCALILTYYEPGAPRWLWINLLFAIALLRVLPAGKLRVVVQIYHWGVVAGLSFLIVPFGINQVREAIYPVLEHPWQQGDHVEQAPHDEWSRPAAAPVAAGETADAAPATSISSLRVGGALNKSTPKQANESRGESFDQYDPTTQIQTGPGLPQWHWNSYALVWSGPVDQSQTINLWLISPAMNAVLNLLRLSLLMLLMWRFIGKSARKLVSIFNTTMSRSMLSLVGICLLSMTAQPKQAFADFPTPDHLKELEARLLEPPECLPNCGDIAAMYVFLKGDRLSLRLAANMEIAGALPLPGLINEWRASQVLIDGKPAEAMRNKEGTLWVNLPQGPHQVMVAGSVNNRDSINLSLPVKPRRLESDLDGWDLIGLREDGGIEAGLVLNRISRRHEEKELRNEFPPLVLVERTISLGLQWTSHVRVSRESTDPVASNLSVPLLPGESVLTPDIQSRDGHVVISLPAHVTSVEWDSTLKPSHSLLLTAAKLGDVVEQWRFKVGPQWHAEFSGAPPIHQQTENQWAPLWQPWPGEELKAIFTKPQGVPGQSLTIDRSAYSISPGLRNSELRLELDLRSSKGGQHKIVLPEKSELLSLTIDGVTQAPISEGRNVPLAFAPGGHRVSIEWKLASGISTVFRTPELDLGIQSVNSNLHLHLSPDRWIIMTGGPSLGPAVLFWGVLLMAIVVAFGLGKTAITPLSYSDWVLLALGLTQSPTFGAAAVIGWLFAMGYRRRFDRIVSKGLFNCVQIILAIWTLLALGCLVFVIAHGLMGHPEMQILGNSSSNVLLNWYQDRNAPLLPQAWVLSVPLWIYKVLMLLWALWLAYAMVNWLRWSWECFSQGGYWRKIQFKRSAKIVTTSIAESQSTATASQQNSGKTHE